MSLISALRYQIKQSMLLCLHVWFFWLTEFSSDNSCTNASIIADELLKDTGNRTKYRTGITLTNPKVQVDMTMEGLWTISLLKRANSFYSLTREKYTNWHVNGEKEKTFRHSREPLRFEPSNLCFPIRFNSLHSNAFLFNPRILKFFLNKPTFCCSRTFRAIILTGGKRTQYLTVSPIMNVNNLPLFHILSQV